MVSEKKKSGTVEKEGKKLHKLAQKRTGVDKQKKNGKYGQKNRQALIQVHTVKRARNKSKSKKKKTPQIKQLM